MDEILAGQVEDVQGAEVISAPVAGVVTTTPAVKLVVPVLFEDVQPEADLFAVLRGAPVDELKQVCERRFGAIVALQRKYTPTLMHEDDPLTQGWPVEELAEAETLFAQPGYGSLKRAAVLVSLALQRINMLEIARELVPGRQAVERAQNLGADMAAASAALDWAALGIDGNGGWVLPCHRISAVRWATDKANEVELKDMLGKLDAGLAEIPEGAEGREELDAKIAFAECVGGNNGNEVRPYARLKTARQALEEMARVKEASDRKAWADGLTVGARMRGAQPVVVTDRRFRVGTRTDLVMTGGNGHTPVVAKQAVVMSSAVTATLAAKNEGSLLIGTRAVAEGPGADKTPSRRESAGNNKAKHESDRRSRDARDEEEDGAQRTNRRQRNCGR